MIKEKQKNKITNLTLLFLNCQLYVELVSFCLHDIRLDLDPFLETNKINPPLENVS
jgi:hypothetical protein